MALASPTSLGLQDNRGFICTASCNGLSRSPFRDTPDTYLALLDFLSHRRRFYIPFLVSLTLKPEPCDWRRHVLLLAEAGMWPLIQLHLCQLSVFSDFLHCLVVLKLDLYTGVTSNSKICLAPPLERACTTTLGSKFFFNFFSHIGNLAGWDLGLRPQFHIFHFLKLFISLNTGPDISFHFLMLLFSSYYTFYIFYLVILFLSL